MEKTGPINKLKKKTYTIFGHTGFIGSFLRNKLFKEKLILPKKGQLIFKKNLGHIIYCIGSDDWLNDSYNSYYANLGYIPEIINKNNYSSFTFLSTTRIYFNNKITNENSTLKINPKNINDYYNIKKICAESFLEMQNKKIKIIRLSNIYGKNYKSPLLVPTLIRDAIKKNKIKITVNKFSTKDYLNIDDTIDLIIKIVNFGKENTYNVASGKNIKIIEIANKIKELTNCKIKFKNQNLLIKEPVINITKIKNEFNFSPKSNLIFDLKNLLIDFHKNTQ